MDTPRYKNPRHSILVPLHTLTNVSVLNYDLNPDLKFLSTLPFITMQQNENASMSGRSGQVRNSS